jgi:hypothetical protein
MHQQSFQELSGKVSGLILREEVSVAQMVFSGRERSRSHVLEETNHLDKTCLNLEASFNLSMHSC